MTHGDPLPPTIFKVVVDVVVLYCESLVAERAGGHISDDDYNEAELPAGKMIQARDDGHWRVEEGHARLKVKAALIYADDGMVAYTNPGWTQYAFDTLTGIFDRVGLKTNVRKTIGMVCQPCRAAGVQADEAYTQWMMGEGQSFKESQREQVLCPEYRKDLAKGSLVAHRQTQHGVAKGGLGQEGGKECGGDEPRTFRIVFPAKKGPSPWPVEGYSGQTATRTAMRVYFWHRHVRDNMVILEEGKLPYPWCSLCDMLVMWLSLKGIHQRTAQYEKGVEWKRRC